MCPVPRIYIYIFLRYLFKLLAFLNLLETLTVFVIFHNNRDIECHIHYVKYYGPSYLRFHIDVARLKILLEVSEAADYIWHIFKHI